MTDVSVDETGPAADQQPDERAVEVGNGWLRWAAEWLLAGSSVEDVVAVMVANDIPADLSAALCADILVDPLYQAGLSMAQQYHKLGSMLAMQQTMLDLAPHGRELDRRSGLTREEFLDEYYSRNRPVILEDICADWRACSAWSPEYLLDKLGDVPVEVMAERDADPDYEANSTAHKTVMPFREYVERIVATPMSNDLYLVANNRLLDTPAADALWEDFALDRRFLQPHAAKDRTFLWFGAGGTITPLHHDVMNVMFHQVAGRKRFTLVASGETPRVYNSHSVYSEVDPKSPDLDRFPAYAAAHPITFDIGPGEGVFIPVGWWHHVESLEQSISVSSSAFAFPNEIEWFSPVRVP